MNVIRNTTQGAVRWLLVAVFVLVFSAAPALAETPVPDDRTAKEAPRAETVLATESAARLGIERAKASERTESSAMQITDDPTMKWLLIIGIAAVAVLLIVTLAD